MGSEEKPMRAFLAACAAALVIAICGAVVLGSVNRPVSSAFTTSSVRI
jgi:hypothetical protein